MKNNSLVLLIILFIVISFISFFISPNNVIYLSGRAVTASTSFNISEEISLLVTGSVNFGSGRVYPNASEATLESSLGYFNNYDWLNLSPSGAVIPDPFLKPVVYHKKWDVFIMLDDSITWQYNYSDNTWLNLTNSSNKPSPATDYGMVYDSSIDEIILFGGGTSPLAETWKFNSTKQWERLYPDVSPPARNIWPGMAFDSRRNVSVLFGGSSGTTYLSDTWEYDATLNNWTNKTKVVYPEKRNRLFMTFDSKRNVTVLFGGRTYSLSSTNDTWEYNGSDWVDRTSTIINAPSPRRLHGLTYDSLRGKVILVGGIVSTAPLLNDTWEYNGTHWIKRPDFISKRMTYLAFDSKENKTLLFGGYLSVSNYANDVWEYNATEIPFDTNASINGSWYFERGWLNIENDGTVNVSVNYSADKNAAEFIGGTNPSFKIKGVNVIEEAGSCVDLNETYAEVPKTGILNKKICDLLKFGNSNDFFKVYIKLIIPADIESGERNSTLTFTATQV